MLTSNLNDTIGTLPIRLYENLMNISLQQILEDSIFNKCITFLNISRHKILQHRPNLAEKQVVSVVLVNTFENIDFSLYQNDTQCN